MQHLKSAPSDHTTSKKTPHRTIQHPNKRPIRPYIQKTTHQALQKPLGVPLIQIRLNPLGIVQCHIVPRGRPTLGRAPVRPLWATVRTFSWTNYASNTGQCWAVVGVHVVPKDWYGLLFLFDLTTHSARAAETQVKTPRGSGIGCASGQWGISVLRKWLTA